MKKNKGFKIDDRLLLAAFAGGIAAIAADISLYLINLYLPGKNINMNQVTLEFFLTPTVTTTVLLKIIGVLWSTIVGGIYALIYLISLDMTGWKNSWLKSIIVINGIWLLGGGIIINMLDITTYTRNEPLSIFAFYFAHLLFATYLYFIVNKYGVPREVKVTNVEDQTTQIANPEKRIHKQHLNHNPVAIIANRIHMAFTRKNKF